MFGGGDDEDDDGEWRFSVDEVGEDDPDDEVGDAATGDAADEERREWGDDPDGVEQDRADTREDADDDEGDGGNVAGALVPDMSVESGTPELENVAFVAAGVLFTVLAFASLAVPLGLREVALAVGAIAAVAGLLYVVFRRY